jgi:hypothetical protein
LFVGCTLGAANETGVNHLAKKRKAKKNKIERKRKAKKSKPKKRSSPKVDLLTPTVSDEALERSAILPNTAACTERHCL